MSVDPYIRIAVISDLHCQKEENNFKVTRLHTKLLDKADGNPITALKKNIAEEGKKVDYFFVLGDITDKGSLEGFNMGVSLVKQISSSLNAEKLIFTVGNHDMHRRKKDDGILDSEYLMKNTNDFPFLFKDCSKIQGLEDEFWANQYCIIEDDKTIILVLNTSYCMDMEDNLKPMKFDHSLSSSIEQKLSQINDNQKLKIAICHHHPTSHADIKEKYTSLDCITQGGELIRLLQKHNFSLLMHGHKHFPLLNCYDNFPVFCSGSFSSLENIDKNTIHFIDIYQETSKYKGTVETWSYNPFKGGWLKDADLNTIFPVYTGFGTALDTHIIAGKIYEAFFKRHVDSESTEQYIPIEMRKVVNKFQEVVFLTPAQQKDLECELEKLKVETNINKQGEKIFRIVKSE